MLAVAPRRCGGLSSFFPMNSRIADNQDRRVRKLQAICAAIEAALDVLASMIVAQSPELLATDHHRTANAAQALPVIN